MISDFFRKQYAGDGSQQLSLSKLLLGPDLRSGATLEDVEGSFLVTYNHYGMHGLICHD